MPIEFVIENSKAKKINNTGNPNILTIRLLKINEINDQKIALTKKKKINVEIIFFLISASALAARRIIVVSNPNERKIVKKEKRDTYKAYFP